MILTSESGLYTTTAVHKSAEWTPGSSISRKKQKKPARPPKRNWRDSFLALLLKIYNPSTVRLDNRSLLLAAVNPRPKRSDARICELDQWMDDNGDRWTGRSLRRQAHRHVTKGLQLIYCEGFCVCCCIWVYTIVFQSYYIILGLISTSAAL